MTTRRQQRVSELLHQELSIVVSTELNDPRLQDALVTVTHVEVSQDLRSARVYVEHALGSDASRLVLAALQRAEGFMRKALAENVNLRYVPQLTFQVDETGTRVRRIDELLDALRAQETTHDESNPSG